MACGGISAQRATGSVCPRSIQCGDSSRRGAPKVCFWVLSKRQCGGRMRRATARRQTIRAPPPSSMMRRASAGSEVLGPNRHGPNNTVPAFFQPAPSPFPTWHTAAPMKMVAPRHARFAVRGSGAALRAHLHLRSIGVPLRGRLRGYTGKRQKKEGTTHTQEGGG